MDTEEIMQMFLLDFEFYHFIFIFNYDDKPDQVSFKHYPTWIIGKSEVLSVALIQVQIHLLMFM